MKTTETRFHAESYHGDLSPMLGGVVPPSNFRNFRVRLPNGGRDIQLMSTQLVQQLRRTTLALGTIDTGDLLACIRSTASPTQVEEPFARCPVTRDGLRMAV